MVESFKSNQIEYYENIPDSGTPSAPRNLGIKKSRGEYIAFCDDDDIWMPNKISAQVKALEVDKEFGLAYCKTMRFNKNKEWIVDSENGLADFESLLFRTTVACSSILIRKSLILKHGAFLDDKRVGNSEDYEFLLRHSQHTRLAFVDEYLLKYWSGDGRLTNEKPSKVILFSLINLKSNLNIHLITYKSSKVPAYKFVLPALYKINVTLRIILYSLIFTNLFNKTSDYRDTRL